MALTIITPAQIKGSFDANGDVAMTDVATSLLVWGTVNFNQLRTPSILRTELANVGLTVADDRRGTWSKIKTVRDKILSDLAVEL